MLMSPTQNFDDD